MSTSHLPDLIATWQQQHVLTEGSGDPQWLISLKGTLPGDRLIVSEAGGRGLVLVVDFASKAEPASGRYYSWGVCTPLRRAIGFDELRQGVFRPQRGGDLRWLRGGPKHLHEDEALRIAELAGGLPAARAPKRPPRQSDGKEIWPATGGLSPERITEELVVDTARIWRQIGFPSQPQAQRHTSLEDRPDLLAESVVGEVKNQIRSDWGPPQIERYLKTLDHRRPKAAPWHGVLIHAERKLAESPRDRLTQSQDAHRIQVWGVYRRRRRARGGKAPVLKSDAMPQSGRAHILRPSHEHATSLRACGRSAPVRSDRPSADTLCVPLARYSRLAAAAASC